MAYGPAALQGSERDWRAVASAAWTPAMAKTQIIAAYRHVSAVLGVPAIPPSLRRFVLQFSVGGKLT